MKFPPAAAALLIVPGCMKSSGGGSMARLPRRVARTGDTRVGPQGVHASARGRAGRASIVIVATIPSVRPCMNGATMRARFADAGRGGATVGAFASPAGGPRPETGNEIPDYARSSACTRRTEQTLVQAAAPQPQPPVRPPFFRSPTAFRSRLPIVDAARLRIMRNQDEIFASVRSRRRMLRSCIVSHTLRRTRVLNIRNPIVRELA